MTGPVAVVGCGGLGVPAAWTLALGGIRHLRLIDPDVVDASNLHRQVLYAEAEVGQGKAEHLAKALQRQVPGLHVEISHTRVGISDIGSQLADCVAVLECTDDAVSKFLVNDHAAAHGLHATIAAAIGRRGQWFTHVPGGPCYRCLFETPPPEELLGTCAVAGVLGTVTGQVGALAAKSLLRGLRGEQDAAAGALVRLSPRGWQRTVVLRADDCRLHG